jgi:hypothetical protein
VGQVGLYRIEPATALDVPRLPEIERQACALFSQVTAGDGVGGADPGPRA